ncbi:MAG: nucleoside deaminase [Pseudobutyrivibrio sp.]|nr:nucleoside deaminase [Pseudobutyrivibrio sp.]
MSKDKEKDEKKLSKQNEKYMKLAIKEAKKAYKIDEVPIGCVIVQNDRVIAKGHNKRNTKKCALAHAEITAIKKACKKTGDWRLEDCTLYVTLEPCQMCAGAIVQSRMQKVVVGAMNKKAGCAGSILNLLQMSEFNHRCELETGVCGEECTKLMSSFFEELRTKKAQKA